MKILLMIWLKVNSTNPTLCSLCKVEIQSHYSFNVYWDARIFQISILSTFVFQKYEICKDVYTYSSFCVLVCWNFIGLLWYLNPDSNSKMNFSIEFNFKFLRQTYRASTLAAIICLRGGREKNQVNGEKGSHNALWTVILVH